MTTIAVVVIAAVVGPLLLSMLNNRQALAREERSNERQDAVATKAAEAADLLAEAQAETIKKTDEVARVAAETTSVIGEKLGVIHDLVNSNVTALKQSELDGAKRELVMMQRLIDLPRNGPPVVDDLATLEATRTRILDLESELATRQTQQERLDAGVQGSDP